MKPLRSPIVVAPMAGGVSTPELVAAVAEAGALGFLPAGYRSVEALAAEIEQLRALTARPFGVNVFSPPEGETQVDAARLDAYRATLAAEAERYGASVGESRADDDAYEAKLALLRAQAVDYVSFTFGCPSGAVVKQLHAESIEVWVTVTDPAEAEQARAAGADALVVQGIEAGGHRGYFRERPGQSDYGLLALLRLVATRLELPLIAAGGIPDGAAVAAVLCAGAVAAQLGSAFMLTPEAATAPAHRERLAASTPTRFTRAFTGRQARGVVNRFMEEHEDQAPSAYPQLHHMTSPIRAAARAQGDPEAINLWAGQAHHLAQPLPAGELVRQLVAETRAALTGVQL